ncbi:MAG: hypothetical protein V3U06_04210, partial [Candidatus Binatia bacterium]
MAKNFRFVLRDTVSISALRTGTTAATGLPSFTTTIGSFLALRAYSESGLEGCLISIFFIVQ